jgi:hypothetical protein
MKKYIPLILSFVLGVNASSRGEIPVAPVTVTVTDTVKAPDLSDSFMGLSYEMSMLLPNDGRYYFDPKDQSLIQTFQTLGIKSLRVGANAVDDPRIAVPQEKDIDVFFNFARAAGVKVIYSFRLKDGDPAESARLASYIATHDSDVLDCFSIGNEPNYYLKTFSAFFAQWKPHYDSILKAVPEAKFDGPSVLNKDDYARSFVNALLAEGHLAMASNHYYFLGSGRNGEKDPAAMRARLLSDKIHETYEKSYASMGKGLAAQGLPYRIDELNNSSQGGTKDASDAYASTLWALDCTNWWASHHILGMNYHTGESVGRDGGFAAANYATFVHSPDGNGFDIRPQAYAFLAFSQSANGRPLTTDVQANAPLNCAAYAYRDHDGSLFLVLINKSYGDGAQAASVTLQLPPGMGSGPWQRMDLLQKDSDVAAKTGLTLGDGLIDSQGKWSGVWKTTSDSNAANPTVVVAPASASILHIPAGQ